MVYTKNMNSVTCPHCGKIVEITQAITHQLEQKIKSALEVENKEEIEKLKKDLEEKIKKKTQEELEFKLKDSANELEEAKNRNKQLQEQLLELNKTMRSLRDQSEKQTLENEKRLQKEVDLARESIVKAEQERSNLEKRELEKKLDDMKKALEDAQRKAEQKSQQLQGEVLELDLEEQLKNTFVHDEILPVPKGIEGADIWQKVRNSYGQAAGSILWETKRTKAWSNSWASKLREDARQVGASMTILVSDNLPNGIKTFGLYENVWVSCYEYALPLAQVLRRCILEVAIAKSAAANKDEKLEALYQYLTDNTFKHRFEAQVDSIIELKNDLESEQRSMIRSWKKREVQINRMRNNIASMYGELQGIVGPALAPIKSLDSLPLDSVSQDHILEAA